MATTTPRRLLTLQLRLESQLAELATCTTPAMARCVEESIADTRRQIAEIGVRS